MKMEIFFILVVLSFCGWVYYRLQKKIEEKQSAEKEDFKKKYPEYFQPPQSISHVYRGCGWTEQKRKEFLEGIWTRYNSRHQQSNEQ